MNRGRENVTETECAVACAAVNIASELRYARKAAPAIWPRRLHPSPFSPKLLLALSNSPLRTLTHTCSKYETVCASCVCEPICVSVCVCVCRWCFGSLCQQSIITKTVRLAFTRISQYALRPPPCPPFFSSSALLFSFLLFLFSVPCFHSTDEALSFTQTPTLSLLLSQSRFFFYRLPISFSEIHTVYYALRCSGSAGILIWSKSHL